MYKHYLFTIKNLYLLECESERSREGDIGNSLHKLCYLETLGTAENGMSVLKDFSDNICKNKEHRYKTKLLFKDNHTILFVITSCVKNV